jgi:hypothetical protein
MRSSAACALSLALWLAAPAAGEAPALTLPELMQRMASTSGVETRFREVRELALLSAPLESRGLLYFVPPDRLARFTTEPVASALIVDGERVRFREGAQGEEVDLSGSRTARTFVEHFLVLWSGDLERLERLYHTEFSAEGPRWSLLLTPRGAPLDRFVASVALRGDDHGLAEIALQAADGDRTTTRFESTQLDRRFSPQDLQRLFGDGLPLAAAAGGP